jgi:hypothetical protein
MIKFTGGNGSTMEEAIIILNAESESEGVNAEYKYISDIYGEMNVCWKAPSQEFLIYGGKFYDVLQITFPNAEDKEFWFDITDFFGKKSVL